LEIDALNGEPGVYSARYAGEEKKSEANIQKVLNKLQAVSNRKARFRTVIALILNGIEYIFEGEVNGVILAEKRGESGFGYDPIFKPNGYEQSFAEMPLEVKNRISHRFNAVFKLVTFLKTIE
jgi:XTP/dITP diphosphohydrolase